MSDTPASLYRLFDVGGNLLYVGIGGNPEARIRQHRLRAWGRDIDYYTVKRYPSRSDAAAAELAAIASEHPRYNVIGTGSAAQRRELPNRGQRGEDFIGLIEAAEILGCSVKTLRRRIADGSLPAYRSGRRMIRVRRSDVLALLRVIPNARDY